MQHFTVPRGEFVLVLEGNKSEATRWTEAELLGAIHRELENGETPSALAARLAESSGWRRREIYALTIKQEQKRMR
jgi:16S rRNA C1402 (ribose-2'-O) methylase RsmI